MGQNHCYVVFLHLNELSAHGKQLLAANGKTAENKQFLLTI